MRLLAPRILTCAFRPAAVVSALALAILFAPAALAKATTPLPHVEKRGEGDTNLILIHGLNADWRAWKVFMTDLDNEDRYTMYAVTLPGFGGTEPPPEEMPGDSATPWLDNAVQATVDLIERRGIEDPVVIGHASLGGFLALRLGIEHPDLVSNIIVVDALVPALPIMGDMPSKEERNRIVDLLEPQFANLDAETWESMQNVTLLARNSDYHALLQEMMDEAPRSVAVPYLVETMRVDLTDELIAMQTPALFMYSWPADMSENEKQSRTVSMKLATRIPSGDYVTVGRSQKYIMLDRPDGFTYLVDRYLTTGDVEAAFQ